MSESRIWMKCLVFSRQKNVDNYHGNWPGPASSPPIIRLFIDRPHEAGLMSSNLSAGNALGSTGVGTVVATGMPVEKIKGRSPGVGLGRISVTISGLAASIGTRIGWRLPMPGTFLNWSGSSNSSEMLGGQFWNVRGSSKSKKKNFLSRFGGGPPPWWWGGGNGRWGKPKLLWRYGLKL